MDKNLADLINQQINKELFSAYLYLDFANYYTDEELLGFANWFNVQAQEERDHALLFMQYLQNNDEKVNLYAIEKPDVPYANYDTPLIKSLEHEKYVTASINNIYAKAMELKDFRTMQFLDWFIKEQGEEENAANALIKKFQLFGSDPKSLYMLDNELKTRVYAPPSLTV